MEKKIENTKKIKNIFCLLVFFILQTLKTKRKAQNRKIDKVEKQDDRRSITKKNKLEGKGRKKWREKRGRKKSYIKAVFLCQELRQ